MSDPSKTISQNRFLEQQIAGLKQALADQNAELATTRNRFELVNQAVNEGLWDMTVIAGDPVNLANEFWWADNFRSLLGFSDESDFPNVLGSWANRLHPEDSERTLTAFAAHLNDRSGVTPYDIEYRLQRKDQSYGWFRARGATMRDENGIPLRVAGSLADISARKQQEERVMERNRELAALNTDLAAIRARFELVNQAVNEGLWDMTVVAGDSVNMANEFWWADNFRALLGFADENDFPNVLGSWANRLHPEDSERTLTAFAAHLNDRSGVTPYDIEYRLQRKDQSYGWFRARGSTQRDDSGIPLRVAGSLADISSRKQQEERVTERTNELAELNAVLKKNEIELLAARAQAEQASQMKSDFLANMSHEIRTPMNAVIGMSHLVLSTELTAKQRDYIEKIQRSSHHLLRLINDILDLSKIEAGKLEVESVDFELSKVLENVANLIGEKCAHKQLELVFDVDPALPDHLLGDPLRLGQILINYANNAVKFTEHGELVIRVRLLELKEDGLLVRFDVEDTGIGLNAEQISRLFQSFAQADASTTRKYGGTGLGLAISKELAERMGGSVGVTSVVGQGSKFWFTALVGRGANDINTLMPHPDLRARRVLVVDDNSTARLILSEMLRGMSFDVSEAESGARALHLAQAALDEGRPYEVAYLDRKMPGMDGLETARRLAFLATPPCPVMVTGYGYHDVFRDAERAGISLVLLKPVSASLLLDASVRALGGKGTNLAADVHKAGQVGNTNLANIHGARVLLVDDNDLNQQVGVDLLESVALVVDVAGDGQKALDMLAKARYDIVLMDMQMPVMDGVTATRLIRAQPVYANLPVVAMTANAMSTDRDRCLAAGMNDHLAKPIEPDELFAMLLRWIPVRATAQAANTDPESEMVGLGMPTAAGESQDNAGNHMAHGRSMSALDSIVGLDVAAGMKRVLNKRDAYDGMLRLFLDSHADTLPQTNACLAAGARDDARRHIHTLKGTAGTIGAASVAQLAAAVEAALADGLATETVQSLLTPLETAMAGLIGGLKNALDDSAMGIVAASRIDWSSTRTMVNKLQSLLEDDDSDAVELFEQSGLLLKAVSAERYVEMERAMSRYLLVEALATLREIKTATPELN